MPPPSPLTRTPVQYPEAGFAKPMTVIVKLKPDVASVLAEMLVDHGSCCWCSKIAMNLNIDEVERMDRELEKLASYIAAHAPGLATS